MRKFIVLSFIAGACVALAPNALGQDARKPARAEDRARAMVERLDTDGDGLLSAAEIAAAHERGRPGATHGRHIRGRRGAEMRLRAGGRREQLRERFDGDGDGKLSEVERENARTTLKAEILAKHDQDGDGKLDRAERAAARAEKLAEIKASVDTSGDGRVDDAERAAARATRREEMRAKILAKFDTNGDGTVDDAEREAVRTAHQARRGERFGRRSMLRGPRGQRR